jgi:short-subunit dehydrogenase
MPASAVFAPGATALITGAAAGIGLAIAKLCQSKGMSLFLVDINADDLEAAKKALSTETNTVVTAVTDVSDTSQWQSLKATAADRFGSIELLVLNAGKGMKGGWGEEDYFRQVIL